MDILATARKLESKIARTLDRAARRVTKPVEREPLEIVHAVLDAIDEEIQQAGRDTRVFPFNRIKVSVLAPSRRTRARFEAVFGGTPSLGDRIVERLAAAACDTSDLVVRIAYVAQAEPQWMAPDCEVEFDRLAVMPDVPAEPPPAPIPIELDVVAGLAEQPRYSFTLARIDLGRCAEVRDHRRRLVRSNHVAFVDSDAPANQSVSRRHAHIRHEPQTGEFRLYDDRSAQGTGVLRGGKTIAVPPGTRGIRLQPGDEIVLGEAKLRVTFDL